MVSLKFIIFCIVLDNLFLHRQFFILTVYTFLSKYKIKRFKSIQEEYDISSKYFTYLNTGLGLRFTVVIAIAVH